MALQFENNSFGPGNKPKPKKISGGQKKLDNPLANALMGGTPAANPMGGTEMDFDMPDMGAMQMNAPSSMGDGYGNMMEKMLWTNELDQNTGKMVYGPPTGKVDLEPYKDPSGSSVGGGIDDPLSMRAQPTGMAGFAGASRLPYTTDPSTGPNLRYWGDPQPSGETFVDPDRGFINRPPQEGDIPRGPDYSVGSPGRSGMVQGPDVSPSPYEPIDWPTDGDGRRMLMPNPRGRKYNWYGQMDDQMMGGMPMDTPMMNDPMMGQPDMGGPMMNDPMMNDPMMGGMEMGQPDMGQPFMGDPMMGMQGQPQQGQQGDQLGMRAGQQPGQNQIASDYGKFMADQNQYIQNVISPWNTKAKEMFGEQQAVQDNIVDEINTGNPYGDRLAGRSSFAGGQDPLSDALRGPQADFPEAPVAGPETASLPTVSQLDEEVAPSVSEVPATLPPAVSEVATTVPESSAYPPMVRDESGNMVTDPDWQSGKFTDTPEPVPVAPTVSLPPTGGTDTPEPSRRKPYMPPSQGPTGDTPEPADKKPEMVTVDGEQYKKESDRKEGEYGGFASEYPKGSGNWNVMFIDPPAPREDDGIRSDKPADKKPPHEPGEFPHVGNMESGLVEDYYNEHGEMPVPFDDTPPPTSKTPVKPALEEFKDKVDAGEVSDEEPAPKPASEMTGQERKEHDERVRKYNRDRAEMRRSGVKLPAPDPNMVLTDEQEKASAVWRKFSLDMASSKTDAEGILKELGIDKDYMLKMQPVGGNSASDPRRTKGGITMFKGPDGRRFQRKVTQLGNRRSGKTWTEIKMDPAQQRAENQRDSEGIPRPGDRNSKKVTANNGEEGWKLSNRGQPGIGNYGDFVDEDGEIVSFEEPEREVFNGDPNSRPLPPGRAQLPQDAIGTASSESRSVAQEADLGTEDKFSEVGDAAYGDEDLGPPNEREGFNRDDWLIDSHSSADDWLNKKTGERYTRLAEPGEERSSVEPSYPWSQPEMPELSEDDQAIINKRVADRDAAREQEQQELLGSASPEDLNNPVNWYEFSGKYVYKGPEFGKTNTNPPADTENWARTRAEAASKTSGAAAAPEVYLPPDTFGRGDGGGPSDQERKKADKMERDDYDLSPGLGDAAWQLGQDEYGDIDSYNARYLEVTPGSTTRRQLAERDVTLPQQQQLVNKEWGNQWGDAFQQALSPTGRQRISRPGMTLESGNEMQTMATANAMLGGRMAEQLIPHKYALQHSKKVKDLLAFANQEGIDMANLLKSDWYSGANDEAREEAINQQIQNAVANNQTSWR